MESIPLWIVIAIGVIGLILAGIGYLSREMGGEGWLIPVGGGLVAIALYLYFAGGVLGAVDIK